MTFAEWESEIPICAGDKDGAKWVPYAPLLGLSGRLQWNLYHLSDYLVSSISGGTIWLVPRTNATTPALPGEARAAGR